MREFVYRGVVALLACMIIGACSQDVKIPENVARVSKISQQEKTVRAFVTAFSDHNVEHMSNLCADDVKWGYVTNGTYNQAGQGLASLQEEMATYFKETPTVRSEIEGLVVNGDYISVAERVFWQADEGERTQSALSVYYFKDNKIHSVWYYPAQP